MSNFNAHKSQIKKSIHQELDKAPRQFNDYMNSINGRFSEICRIYLDGLSMDDIKYLSPDDLIAIVPQNQYNHKLLMTIMVRRYLYRTDINDCDQINTCQTIVRDPDNSSGDVFSDSNNDNSSDTNSNNNDDNSDQNSRDTRDTSSVSSIKQPKQPKKPKETIYACNKCAHVCKNPRCKHSCENYIKITQKIK
jgi:hypothetical protein